MQLTYLLSEINFMGPAVNFVNEKINAILEDYIELTSCS
jgi:hypothetical protein